MLELLEVPHGDVGDRTTVIENIFGDRRIVPRLLLEHRQDLDVRSRRLVHLAGATGPLEGRKCNASLRLLSHPRLLSAHYDGWS